MNRLITEFILWTSFKHKLQIIRFPPISEDSFIAKLPDVVYMGGYRLCIRYPFKFATKIPIKYMDR